MISRILFVFSLLLVTSSPVFSEEEDWFETLKGRGDAEELYRVLHAMPKGGDLHNHLSGAVFSEWWYEIALAQESRGYEYFTKIKIENCREYGENAFSIAPYLLLFRNIAAIEYESLNACEQSEYKALRDLNEVEKAGCPYLIF